MAKSMSRHSSAMNLATAQACFAAQQHDHVRCCPIGLRSLHEFLEVLEVEERGH
jgi:hypothetical protein